MKKANITLDFEKWTLSSGEHSEYFLNLNKKKKWKTLKKMKLKNYETPFAYKHAMPFTTDIRAEMSRIAGTSMLMFLWIMK